MKTHNTSNAYDRFDCTHIKRVESIHNTLAYIYNFAKDFAEFRVIFSVFSKGIGKHEIGSILNVTYSCQECNRMMSKYCIISLR
jgi:hypothetical protein